MTSILANLFAAKKVSEWDIPLGKFMGAHFAVFPEKIVETVFSQQQLKAIPYWIPLLVLELLVLLRCA